MDEHDKHDDTDKERPMETKHRSGWATVMIALAVLVGAAFVLFLIMTLAGVLD